MNGARSEKAASAVAAFVRCYQFYSIATEGALVALENGNLAEAIRLLEKVQILGVKELGGSPLTAKWLKGWLSPGEESHEA